jgi:integrase
VRRPKASKGRNRRIKSWDEIGRIIEATQSPTLKVLIPLAIETAMRRSEMVNVNINDIDFDNRTIALYEGKTKNGEPRIVPLSTTAIKILRSHKPEADGLLFDIQPNTATVAFQRALKRARAIYEGECRAAGKSPDKHFLTNLRLHDLRHEATSRLFEKTNLREFEIMAITGHKDTRQLKRYTHLRAANLAKRLG